MAARCEGTDTLYGQLIPDSSLEQGNAVTEARDTKVQILQHCSGTYVCHEETLTGKPAKVFNAGKAFFAKWYIDAGPSPPSIFVAVLEEQVLIRALKGHLDSKPIPQRSPRYKILPCVRELLENTTYLPEVIKDEEGKVSYVFFGVTPRGWEFKVVVKRDSQGKLRLITCYPLDGRK
jgi:hypothetical protein